MAESDLHLFDQLHLLDGFTHKQRKLIAAAIDVFAERGYANASTKQIAQAAGVAEGNLFATFKNKRGLLDAILAPMLATILPETLTSFVAANFSQTYTTLDAFCRQLVTDRIAFVQANRKLFKILVAELAYSQNLRQQLINGLPAHYHDTIHAEFADLKARGLLKDWPDAELLRLIFSLIGGAMVASVFLDQPLDAQNSAHLITALTDALKP